MSGIPTAFTRDTLGLMGEQAQFFDSVVEISRRTGVGLQMTSPGSHSVLERKSNGDYSLQMIYVLDDNYRSDDGQLLLTDTFVLNGDSRALSDYSRQIKFVGPQKISPLWQNRQKAFTDADLPNQSQWKKFSRRIGQALARPIFSNSKIWQRIAQEGPLLEYFTQLGQNAWAKVPGIAIKILDPDSHYQRIDHGSKLEYVFHWVLDRDNGAEQGRYFLTERVHVAKSNLKVTQIERQILSPEEVWAHRGIRPSNPQEKIEFTNLKSMKFPDTAESFLAYQNLIEFLTLENHDWEDRSQVQELNQVSDLSEAVELLDDSGRAYWLDLVKGAQSIYPRWTLRTQDKDSWVKIRPLGPYKEVLLQTVLSDFEKPNDKKVRVADRFTVAADFKRVISWSRHVAPATDGKAQPVTDSEWQALQALPAPTSETVSDFMAKMGPAVAPLQVNVFDKVIAAHAKEIDVPVYLSIDPDPEPDAKSFAEAELAKQIFTLVLSEQVQQRISAGKAWFAKDDKVTAKQANDLMDQLPITSKSDVFAALKKLPADSKFSPLRNEILRDPLLRELQNILTETDEIIRNREILCFARSQLFLKHHLYGSAHALATLLSEDAHVGSEAKELRAFLMGKGRLGTKFELMGSTFLDHLFDRNTLLAMMAAGIGGAWAEAQALRALGSYGKFGSCAAKVGGTLSEAAAFTFTQQVGQSFDTDPAAVWKNTGAHLVSASMLFGFLRLGHWGSDRMSQLLRFSGKEGWRGSRLGQLLPGAFRGVAGVEGMYLGGLASRSLGLDAPNDQGLGHHQFDAFVSYLQATLGFRLAHGMSPGIFQQALLQAQFQRHQAGQKSVVKKSAKAKPAEPPWVASGQVETDPTRDPTPLPRPMPLGEVAEVSPVIRRLPLPDGPTSAEVILLTKPKPAKTPPLPPPPPPAKPAAGHAQGKLSDGVPKPIWWDEPTEPHGKLQVSEAVLQETLPHMMRDLITRWAVKRIKDLPETAEMKTEHLAFNLGALLEKSRAFPETTAQTLYGRYRFKIPVQIDPVHRQLKVPPEPKQALQNKGAQQNDPVLKVIYDILVGLDGLQLGPSGKNKNGNTRDRFPTSQPLEPNYPANSDVVEANRSALNNRYHETAPRQLDMTKETVIRRSRYQTGILTMDSEGRIDVRGLSRPNFEVPNLSLLQNLPESNVVNFTVIVAKHQVVWHGSLPKKMNESQRAALNALTETAPEWYEADPYGVDALLQQGMGPLALDLGEVLIQHSRKLNELEPLQDVLVYRDQGLLRAKDAKLSREIDATQLAARVQIEWNKDAQSKNNIKDVKFLWQEQNFSVPEFSKLFKFIQERIQEASFSNGRLPALTPELSETQPESFHLLMGERHAEGPQELSQKYSEGEFFGLTEEGVGYKSFNEDGMATLRGPKGDKIFLLMDGAGGHAPAKDGVELTLRKIAEQVQTGVPLGESILTAHESFIASFSECRSTFLAARIFNQKAQFFWAGDSKALILRKDIQGNWQWVYQTPEDSQARRLVDHEIQNTIDPQQKSELASRRTQEIILHPFSHILSNAFGETTMRLHETEQGSLNQAAGELGKTLALEAGDVILMVSDGFLDNQIQTRRYLELIKNVETPELIAAILYRETQYSMKVLAAAKAARKSGELNPGTRYSFKYEGDAPDLQGKTVFLELQNRGTGILYDAPEGGRVLGHFKADNLSIGVYRHGSPDSDSI